MPISKAEMESLICAGIYPKSPFLPRLTLCGTPPSYSFEKAAVAITGGHGQRTENDRLLTSNILYAEMI